MVVCEHCKKNMEDPKTTTCSKEYPFVVINLRVYKRNTSYFDVNERCHDCNIMNKKGNLHHFGCDMERCPKCGGQLISCRCKAIIGMKRK